MQLVNRKIHRKTGHVGGFSIWGSGNQKAEEETEYLKSTHLIPIAEDPFGNLFCYDFQDEETRIVFWNHEDTDVSQFVCATFTEFVGMLHE